MSAGGGTLDPERLESAFRLVARQVASGRTSYAALAVATGAGLVRSAAWTGEGPVDRAPRTAVASITKPITATAVMQLVERGSLVLLEPITTYLPDVAPHAPDDGSPAEAITAWHILTHTSGIPDASEEFYLTAPATPEAQVERISHEQLKFAPGSCYAYASDSFFILSALITRVTGEPYPSYLQQHVLGPLGMSATSFDPYAPGRTPRPLEGSFGPTGIPFRDVSAYFARMAMPGGGLWSTAEDILRFGRAMLLGGSLDDARIIGRPFVDLMTRWHTATAIEVGMSRPGLYGLGWGKPGLGRGSPASAAAFGHSGATGSMLIVDPTYDLVIVYLRNEWGVSTTATDEAVQAVYAAID